MHSAKVVLVSLTGYSPSRDDPLLQELIASEVELFCSVGVDAEQWEDALDWLCIGADGSGTHFITTTSHPGETEAEVVEFAKLFFLEQPCEVEVIRV
jgi:hypothetical protein